MTELLERLAALEHKQWATWAAAIMSTHDVGAHRRERWTRLIATPYSRLTEEEKEQDRVWARKVLREIEK